MTPVLMAESRLTGSGYNYWREYRRRLYRKWLAWMSVAIATGVVFVVNLTTQEPNVFAVLLIIPLLCLRSAWKLDRQPARHRMLGVRHPQRQIDGKSSE